MSIFAFDYQVSVLVFALTRFYVLVVPLLSSLGVALVGVLRSWLVDLSRTGRFEFEFFTCCCCAAALVLDRNLDFDDASYGDMSLATIADLFNCYCLGLCLASYEKSPRWKSFYSITSSL